MLTECPHCFTRVLPKPDGQCPACQRNTLEVREVDREFITVTVREDSAMPDYCCTCVLPERRLVRISHSRVVWGSGDEGGIGAAAAVALQALAGGVHFLFHAFFSEKRSGSQKVAVSVRQCRECSRRHPLEPVLVNYDAYAIKFVVHRDFARMFGELNSPAGQSS